MEEEIREQIKKDVEQIWETKFKVSFSNQINICLMETLKNLENERINFDSTINSQIQELDKKFEEKWNPTFQNFQNEMSKLSVINNKNNKIQNNDDNPYVIKNNNRKNNNENEINIKNNENEININNNENNLNTIKNYLNNNIVNDNYQKLRDKKIDLFNLKNPPITNLVLLENTNPLINIILQCLSNIGHLVGYYLNPDKEKKILQKSKNNPHGDYLGPSFLKLLDYLWKSNQNEYSPNEIHNSLKKIMKSYYNLDDAGFIIKNILNQLNEELIINPIKINDNNDPYNNFNEQKTLKNFIQNLNKTAISERFFSTIKIKKNVLIVKLNHIFSRHLL